MLNDAANYKKGAGLVHGLVAGLVGSAHHIRTFCVYVTRWTDQN